MDIQVLLHSERESSCCLVCTIIDKSYEEGIKPHHFSQPQLQVHDPQKTPMYAFVSSVVHDSPFGGNLVSLTSPLMLIRTHFKVARYAHDPSHLSSSMTLVSSVRSGRSVVMLAVVQGTNATSRETDRNHPHTPLCLQQSLSLTDLPLYSQVFLDDGPSSIDWTLHRVVPQNYTRQTLFMSSIDCPYVLIRGWIFSRSNGFPSFARIVSWKYAALSTIMYQ